MWLFLKFSPAVRSLHNFPKRKFQLWLEIGNEKISHPVELEMMFLGWECCSWCSSVLFLKFIVGWYLVLVNKLYCWLETNMNISWTISCLILTLKNIIFDFGGKKFIIVSTFYSRSATRFFLLSRFGEPIGRNW